MCQSPCVLSLGAQPHQLLNLLLVSHMRNERHNDGKLQRQQHLHFYSSLSMFSPNLRLFSLCLIGEWWWWWWASAKRTRLPFGSFVQQWSMIHLSWEQQQQQYNSILRHGKLAIRFIHCQSTVSVCLHVFLYLTGYRWMLLVLVPSGFRLMCAPLLAPFLHCQSATLCFAFLPSFCTASHSSKSLLRIDRQLIRQVKCCPLLKKRKWCILN